MGFCSEHFINFHGCICHKCHPNLFKGEDIPKKKEAMSETKLPYQYEEIIKSLHEERDHDKNVIAGLWLPKEQEDCKLEICRLEAEVQKMRKKLFNEALKNNANVAKVAALEAEVCTHRTATDEWWGIAIESRLENAALNKEVERLREFEEQIKNIEEDV